MRIKISDLENIVERINDITGSPQETWERDGAGVLKSNIGNFHLDGAYGGWALHQIMSEGGGVHDIFHGHYTKKELYWKMQAFLLGMRQAEESTK